MIKVELTGISGRKYIFDLHPIGTPFNEMQGLYIFSYYSEWNGLWHIAYIGQTGDFEDRLYKRLKQHEAFPCIKKEGATHIGLHPTLGLREGVRIQLETDLRKYYCDCPCNEQ